MLRSLQGGSGPVVTSAESGNEYQYCEAEAGSAGDTAAACLVSGADDEAAQASAAASVDPGSAEGREDGDLSQAEPCADTRDADTDQDQAVTELGEDSVQEAKFPPPPPPSPPPADTPAPSVASFIVTIGLRKMCKICGMQVIAKIFLLSSAKYFSISPIQFRFPTPVLMPTSCPATAPCSAWTEPRRQLGDSHGEIVN